MPTLEHNISALKLRIKKQCHIVHRDNNSVHLLAVSKTRNADTVKLAYDLGLRQFGENYVTEAEKKISRLPDDIEWHFIGPIQSNKTRFISEHFSWVQTIDRLKIARRLNQQRPDNLPMLQCLIQINISSDPKKAGIAPEEMLTLAEQISTMPKLQLRGLMAIPKASQASADLNKDFSNMAKLLRQLQTIYKQADTLSMGMSSDLETAITHGSTMVRIGTDLFGPRQ